MQQTNQTHGTTEPRKLFPNHATLAELGPELIPADPPCERTMRNLMERLAVPYVKLAGQRFYDRDVVRAAILASQVNRQVRGRGRPRTAA